MEDGFNVTAFLDNAVNRMACPDAQQIHSTYAEQKQIKDCTHLILPKVALLPRTQSLPDF